MKNFCISLRKISALLLILMIAQESLSCTGCTSSQYCLKGTDCVDKCPAPQIENASGNPKTCDRCVDPNLYQGITLNCVKNCDDTDQLFDKNDQKICQATCPSPNGKDDTTKPKTCEPCTGATPYYNPVTSTCVANCPPNYIINAQNICQDCNPKYKDPIQNKCFDSCFYYLLNGICVQNCPAPQEYNNNNPKSCDACTGAKSFYGPDQRCAASCPPNQRWDAQNICIDCGSQQKVPNENRCDPVCSYYLQNSICVTDCPVPYEKNTNTKTCDPCSDPKPYFGLDNKCVASCPDNYQYDGQKICKSCSPQWKDPIENKCYPTCYYYLLNNICFASCPAPQEANNNHNPKTCDPCSVAKPYYSPDKTCTTSCPDNYRWDVQSICISCGSQYKVPNENRCDPVCSYYLQNNICVIDCPIPYEKNTVTKNCDPCSGQKPQFGPDSKCANKCPDNQYYDAQKICKNCAPQQKDPIENKCQTTCFYYMLNNLCVYSCPAPYEANNQNTPHTCDSCSVAKPYQGPDKKCVTVCPDNQIIGAQNICVDCGTNQKVPNENRCDPVCAFFLLNNVCVLDCQSPYERNLNNNPKTCDRCVDPKPYFGPDRKCVENCPDNFYFDPQKICLNCAPQYKDPYENVCYANCKYYLLNNLCLGDCPSSYEKNDLTSPRTCDACKNPKPYYGPNKVCVASCPDNQKWDANNICISCAPDYKVPNENRCDKDCNFQILNKVCYSDCPAGQEKNDAISPKTCDPCPFIKPQFGPDNKCAGICPDNYIFDVNKICINCAPGQKVPLANRCEPSCSFYLLNSICVADCPAPQERNNNKKPKTCEPCTGDKPYYGPDYTCISTCPMNWIYDAQKACVNCGIKYKHPFENRCEASCSYILFNNLCYGECPPPFVDTKNTNPKSCEACPIDKIYQGTDKQCHNKCPDNYIYDEQKICISCGLMYKVPDENRCTNNCTIGAFLNKVSGVCLSCTGVCEICAFPTFQISAYASCVPGNTVFYIVPKSGSNYVQQFELSWPIEIGILKNMNIALKQQIGDIVTNAVYLNDYDGNSRLHWTFDTQKFDSSELQAKLFLTNETGHIMNLDIIKLNNQLASLVQSFFLAAAQQTKIETIASKFLAEIDRNGTNFGEFAKCEGEGTQKNDGYGRCECNSNYIGIICGLHVGNILRLIGNYSLYLEDVVNGKTLVEKIAGQPKAFQLLCKIKNQTTKNIFLKPFDGKCLEYLKKLKRDQFASKDDLITTLTVVSTMLNDTSWKNQAGDIYKILRELIESSYRLPAGSITSNNEQGQAINQCGSVITNPLRAEISVDYWDFSLTLFESNIKYCEMLIQDQSVNIDAIGANKNLSNLTNIIIPNIMDEQYHGIEFKQKDKNNISISFNSFGGQEYWRRECMQYDDSSGDWSKENMITNDTNQVLSCSGPLKRIQGIHWIPQEPNFGLSKATLIWLSFACAAGFFACVGAVAMLWQFYIGKQIMYSKPSAPIKLESTRIEEASPLQKDAELKVRMTESKQFVKKPNLMNDKVIVDATYQKQGMELEMITTSHVNKV